MKLPARSVVWLLPLCLTACAHLPFHKAKNTAAPIAPPVAENAAPPKPEPSPTVLPPSASTIPSQPLPNTTTAARPTRPPKPPSRHKKPVAPQSGGNQQAAAEIPAVNAIGQLSSGDPSDLRQQTVESLSATERGLNGVNRKLNDQEQKTAAQIREFLKQAHTALATGDVDGAHTLAAKAKVLLNEIVQ